MDIYVDQGGLEPGALRRSKSSLELVAAQLQTAVSLAGASYGFLGRWIFAGQINELKACLAELQDLSAQLDQYTALLSSSPRALIEADANMGSGLGSMALDLLYAASELFENPFFGGLLGTGAMLELIASMSQGGTSSASEGASGSEGSSASEGASMAKSAPASDGASAAESGKGDLDSALNDRDAVKQAVAEFEKEHPKYAGMMNEVLSDPDLTDQRRLDIKYIVYTAPEPYQTLYLEHVAKYMVNVSKKSSTGGSYFNPATEVITLINSEKTFENNPRGPYNTFFHESGHAIDDYETVYGTRTNKYSYGGKSLHSIIVADTRNYVNNLIDNNERFAYVKALSPEERHLLLKSLNLTDDAGYYNHRQKYDTSSKVPILGVFIDLFNPPQEIEDPWKLDQPYQDMQNDIKKYMEEQDLNGEQNEAASDIISGITNNALIGEYNHSSDPDYWYENEKATGNQERELWAEFFAAQMTHDEAALESIRAHFPQAYEAMEAMAREMAGN